MGFVPTQCVYGIWTSWNPPEILTYEQSSAEIRARAMFCVNVSKKINKRQKVNGYNSQLFFLRNVGKGESRFQ